MLLIIHAGLHKTASTYLQAVLVRNGRSLHEAGVYFEPDGQMLANHNTAGHALLGNPIGIREHVKLARSRQRERMILSSEDFETMIFDHRMARTIEEVAREAGVTEIEWHFCLRDPGEYFASQYAQLAQHCFVDYLATFASVLRDGFVHVVNEHGRLPQVWDHCFDYDTHLTAFAGAVGGSVWVHEFRDAEPFPGHGILDRAVGRSFTYDLPVRPGVLNRRLPPDEVEARFKAKFEAIAEMGKLPAASREYLSAQIHVPEDVRNDCAAAISRLYAPGMERLLQAKKINGRT